MLIMSFDTERFIIEIENRPCIWDSASKGYSDRNLKIRCWDEVIDIFKEKDDMTNEEKKQLGDALQKRWKSIRGCFTRELNRQKTLKSGSGGGSRKSEYVFFNQLQFLKNVVAVREPDPVAGTSGAAEIPDREEVEGREAFKGPKRAKNKETSEDDKFVAVFKKSVEGREKHETLLQDEDRLFLLSLVDTLKKVPPQNKMATKIKIMMILEEATRTVTVPTPSPSPSSGQVCTQVSPQQQSYQHEYSADPSPMQATSYSEDYTILTLGYD